MGLLKKIPDEKTSGKSLPNVYRLPVNIPFKGLFGYNGYTPFFK